MPSNSVHEYEKLVLAVASNRLNVDYSNVWKKFRKEEDAEIKTISYCLRRMTKRKDGSYHVSPTMREFCTALKGADVDWNLTGGKIHFTRKERAVWLFKPKKYQHTISFGGWTRTVGAKTARDTLSALNMYDQYASYQDLFDQEEPLYALVDQFNIPLRRLKDE
jgi:hypothetical protein